MTDEYFTDWHGRSVRVVERYRVSYPAFETDAERKKRIKKKLPPKMVEYTSVKVVPA